LKTLEILFHKFICFKSGQGQRCLERNPSFPAEVATLAGAAGTEKSPEETRAALYSLQSLCTVQSCLHCRLHDGRTVGHTQLQTQSRDSGLTLSLREGREGSKGGCSVVVQIRRFTSLQSFPVRAASGGFLPELGLGLGSGGSGSLEMDPRLTLNSVLVSDCVHP